MLRARGLPDTAREIKIAKNNERESGRSHANDRQRRDTRDIRDNAICNANVYMFNRPCVNRACQWHVQMFIFRRISKLSFCLPAFCYRTMRVSRVRTKEQESERTRPRAHNTPRANRLISVQRQATRARVHDRVNVANESRGVMIRNAHTSTDSSDAARVGDFFSPSHGGIKL